MRLKYLDAKVEQIQKVHTLLYSGFVWAESPQGHAYWQNVADQLSVVLQIGQQAGDETQAINQANSRPVSASGDPK